MQRGRVDEIEGINRWREKDRIVGAAERSVRCGDEQTGLLRWSHRQFADQFPVTPVQVNACRTVAVAMADPLSLGGVCARRIGSNLAPARTRGGTTKSDQKETI